MRHPARVSADFSQANSKTWDPYFFRPSHGGDLRRTNLGTLFSNTAQAAAELPKGERFSSTGALTVEVKSEEAVNRLLQVNSLAGVDVAPSVPAAYMVNTALIRVIPTWVTKEPIMAALQNQGVTHARRRLRRHASGADGLLPSTEVVISFRPNTERPDSLSLCFWGNKTVHKYSEAPPRCFRCQRFGHMAKKCLSTECCFRCEAAHAWRDCPGGTPEKCPNCFLGDSANDPNCHVRKEAIWCARSFADSPVGTQDNRHRWNINEDVPLP